MPSGYDRGEPGLIASGVVVERTGDPMKFDVERAEANFRELGDARFAGPDGEAQVVDFLAGRFESSGYRVERREAIGSRFPQRVALWLGWLGFGAVLTVDFGLIRRPGITSAILAWIVAGVGFSWLGAVLGGRIHFGRRRVPLEATPLAIAWLRADEVVAAPVRVVFQATLGVPGPGPWYSVAWAQPLFTWLQRAIHVFLLVLLASRIGASLAPARVQGSAVDSFLVAYVYPGLMAAVWIGIAALLAWESRHGLPVERSSRTDRRGLAVLLEMARSWPRIGARPIEPVFVATGDELLDRAASRELVRLLRSEWAAKPTLLVVLVGPGAGKRLGIFATEASPSGLYDLVDEAARSLWIPTQDEDVMASASIGSYEAYRPAVAIVGSDPRSLFDDTVNSQALTLAAQLATEIALRWAKQPKPTATPEPAR
jgi:hypothetical protein